MEEKTPNLYITVEYELYVKNSEGKEEMFEKAPKEHPFQFITGFGATLDLFESSTKDLAKGEKFDFTIPVAEAYGEYSEQHVVALDRKMFEIDGKLDEKHVFVGAIVPLMNADGERFSATVSEITDDKITVDLNHPLAGKDLHFKGSIVESREATNQEIQDLLKHLTGEGGCGGNCGGKCGGNCGEGDCNCDGKCQ